MSFFNVGHNNCVGAVAIYFNNNLNAKCIICE